MTVATDVSQRVCLRVLKFLREHRARKVGTVPYYEVHSDSGNTYKVFVTPDDLIGSVCTCESGRYRQGDPSAPPCTHLITVIAEEFHLG